MTWNRPAALLSVALLSCGLAPVLADEQIFVEIEAIPGESQDETHRDWIDAYGLETLIYLDRSDPGWPTKLENIAFVKGTDKASVALHKALNDGTSIGTAVIEVCRPRQSGQLSCHLRIELTDLYVTGISTAGSACTESTNCVPIQTERVEMNYSTIRWIWTDDQGQRKEFSYDVRAGGGA